MGGIGGGMEGEYNQNTLFAYMFAQKDYDLRTSMPTLRLYFHPLYI